METSQAQALARTLGAQLIETHISWVLLTADSAYKIKKPLRLAFVDYGTLEARRHFCEEEVRLNARLAPSLYLGVARITADAQGPCIDGSGPVLEFAVHMRRFPAGALFSERLDAGTLESGHVDALAALLADFHSSAPADVPDPSIASAERRRGVALAALRGARGATSEEEHSRLHDWLEVQAAALTPLWASRQHSGAVRECHGDLHLDNVIATPAGVAAFDGIEFDAALRWIDVIDDIAFAVMDFAARGQRGLAFRLLNAWLDRTGDHAGLPALRFAVVYRALVRAQVELLRGRAAPARNYAQQALGWTQPATPRLVITHGLPGSGKTHESQLLLEREGAIRLRSDVERKRLYGLAMLADSRASGVDLYNEAATRRTYTHLFDTARLVVHAGYTVILDAAFLLRAERDQAREVARELGVPFAILHCEATAQVLRERLLARQGDASEADAGVLEKLRGAAEPLGADELRFVLPR
jgi:aminoglycoside phosphotransferase family enzyme/predicted kinase